MLGDILKNAFFAKGSNRLSAEVHRDFLSVNHEGLFLQVRLKDSLGTSEREAYVVTVLFTFTGKFAS